MPTTSSTRSQPWRRRRPRPYRAEAVILDHEPTMQLDIYPQVVIVTRRMPDGRWTSYAVQPTAVAQQLARVPTSSGLLLPNTIGLSMRADSVSLVVYVPPRVATLRIATSTGERHHRLHLPPLVWAAQGSDYRIWALDRPGFPTSPDQPLFHAPFPNVYPDGSICWGTVGQPGPMNLEIFMGVLGTFLDGSLFNAHLDDGKSRQRPASILALYAELDPEQPYPSNDLCPANLTLGMVLDGTVWS